MGSLGDKFKKLAGDQTRQLLQNFQNAQSSKTRNGYSYGKLNEDGTATLADGTVVQTVVKGRPGQYAPVFNLGNGQGLVDQPEAKFFTVDGNVKVPWCIRPINRTTTVSGDTAIITNYLQLTNLQSEESYLIPIDIAPGTDGPKTRFASSGIIYRLTTNYFFDFSLDGRHILLCSTSGEPAKRYGFYDSDACDLNYCIIENWQIVNGEFTYSNLNYFKLPASTYLNYSASLPTEFFSISCFYSSNPGNSQGVTYNLPIPIVYTSLEGIPSVDFWINSGSSAITPSVAGPSQYLTNSGTSYKTTYIRDYLNINQESVLYSHSINSNNLLSYSFVLPEPFYINLAPDTANPIYIGSYLEGTSVQHIVGKNRIINIPSNIYLEISPTPLGPSVSPLMISDYCTLDGSFQFGNFGEPNSYTTTEVNTSIDLDITNIYAVGISNYPNPGRSFPAVSYNNAIISPKQSMVRYGDIKSTLEVLGVPEIFQNYTFSLGSGPANALSPVAFKDSRTYVTHNSFFYSPTTEDQTMYLDYLQLSQTNSSISVSFEIYPQLCKFGPSKGYSQSIPGKTPVLVGVLSESQTNDQDFSSYTLHELTQTDEGYVSSKQYNIPIASNIGNRALLAIVYR